MASTDTAIGVRDAMRPPEERLRRKVFFAGGLSEMLATKGVETVRWLEVCPVHLQRTCTHGLTRDFPVVS